MSAVTAYFNRSTRLHLNHQQRRSSSSDYNFLPLGWPGTDHPNNTTEVYLKPDIQIFISNIICVPYIIWTTN